MTINTFDELSELTKQQERFFLLLYKSSTEQSDCAFERLKNIKSETSVNIYYSDVNNVRDIHEKYNITSAPSLLEFINGKVKNIFKGCQSENYYKAALSGKGFATIGSRDDSQTKRVIVYTTPTCSWCNTLKTYLKEKSISFTEIDVASNPSKAEAMVKKSGQQGVPQTEINGQIIVGFDKSRINALLEI